MHKSIVRVLFQKYNKIQCCIYLINEYTLLQQKTHETCTKYHKLDLQLNAFISLKIGY